MGGSAQKDGNVKVAVRLCLAAHLIWERPHLIDILILPFLNNDHLHHNVRFEVRYGASEGQSLAHMEMARHGVCFLEERIILKRAQLNE